jgi:carboxypeptidase Q
LVDRHTRKSEVQVLRFVSIGCAFLVAFVVRAQIIPKQPNPFSNQSSSVSQGCSLQKSCAELAPGMIESALGPSPLKENVRYLTTTVGGRMTGTAANEKAVDWAVKAFRAAGIAEVKTESFTLPIAWQAGATGAEIVSPQRFTLRVVSTAWSPAMSPKSGISARVVDVGTGDGAGFARAGDARGAIIFVHQNLLTSVGDLLNEYTRDPAIVDRAVKAHAAAVLWMSTRPDDLPYRYASPPGGGVLAKIPQAIVAHSDAEKLVALLATSQRVRVHFKMANTASGPIQVKNVIAEIRGWDRPEDFVVLGAHLDSWDFGPGALDNGCNAAMVIDAARVIHSSGSLPRRSIRFILFNGEEQEFLGSRAYVEAHRAELNHAIAAIIFESGNAKVTGYSVEGREDMLPELQEDLGPLKTLGVTNFTNEAAVEADNFDFLLQGIPTLLPNQNGTFELPNDHSGPETFDKIDLANVKKRSAIAAITAYAIADDANRIAPRQTHAQIDQLLRDTDLGREMKLEGFWDEWQSGRRGRAQ